MEETTEAEAPEKTEEEEKKDAAIAEMREVLERHGFEIAVQANAVLVPVKKPSQIIVP